MSTFTIGEVAKLVGLPTKTIRFYEDQGIVPKVDRAENGYRLYDDEMVSELKLVKNARDLGLSVSSIKKLMKGCEQQSCEHSREEVLTEIDDYSILLSEKISQFSILKKKLQQLKSDLSRESDCHQSGKYCCNILYQLTENRKD